MPDEETLTDDALVRDLATRADPFIKKRLLDLALRYEMRSAKAGPPLRPITGQDHRDQNSSGDSSQQS
jgi:hypothetical protein